MFRDVHEGLACREQAWVPHVLAAGKASSGIVATC